MLQLGLHLLDFSLYINHVANRYGKLVGAHHKGTGGSILLSHHADALQVRHLDGDGIVGSIVVLAYHLQVQLLLGRDVLLVAHHADTRNNLLHILYLSSQLIVSLAGSVELQAHAHDGLSGLAVIQVLPQLLSDEWHEGVQHLQQNLEELERLVVSSFVDGLRFTIDVGGLHHLQIPARELIPEQLIDSHQGLRDTVFLKEVVHLLIGLLQLSFKPLGGNLVTSDTSLTSLTSVTGYFPALYQTEGIPNLVVEVTALFAECLVEQDIIASRCREHHTHAHTIRTKLLNQFDGVGAVTQ